MKRCDLHIHSEFSDSDADIEGIFKIADSKGVGCIAITDHDTIDGVERAAYYSKIYDIELIPAVELSVVRNDAEVHILGYFIDTSNPNLRQSLIKVNALRRERLSIMIEKLQSLGLDLDKDEVFSKIKNNTPTRLHLALSMVEKRIVTSLSEAFRKYLAPGRPGYAAQFFKWTAAEAIQLIKESGGLSFLAHPQLLKEQSWIEEFVALGLDGLEVVYPRFSPAKISYYKSIADKFGILKSGGSDAHGSYKNFTNVGEVTIPYSWIEDMKQRKPEILRHG